MIKRLLKVIIFLVMLPTIVIQGPIVLIMWIVNGEEIPMPWGFQLAELIK